jgi:site-specific recombinase XerD
MQRQGNHNPQLLKLKHQYLTALKAKGKSSSTVGSYSGDLGVFEKFLAAKKKKVSSFSIKDLKAYLAWLESEGFRINTRRRKVLTAKGFLLYCVKRKKVFAPDLQFMPVMARHERLPWIPTMAEWSLGRSVFGQNPEGVDLRNFLLFSLLSETAAPVAEVCNLQWRDLAEKGISFHGKKPREIAITAEVRQDLARWRESVKGDFVFPGYNRFGPTSPKMTSRGVELFFRKLATQVKQKHWKPKTLRHFAIVRWIMEDVPEPEIQRRLGVHKHYSLQLYQKVAEQRGHVSSATHE